MVAGFRIAGFNTNIGTTAVVGGKLGMLDTTFLQAGSYDIRLCVFATNGTRACCVCKTFALFKKLVVITRIAEGPGAYVATPPGPFVGTSPVVSSNPAPPGVVVPVGGPVSVWGAAFVGECQNRKIKCIDLRAAIGFQVGPENFGVAATLPLYTIQMLSAPIRCDDVPPLDELALEQARFSGQGAYGFLETSPRAAASRGFSSRILSRATRSSPWGSVRLVVPTRTIAAAAASTPSCWM